MRATIANIVATLLARLPLSLNRRVGAACGWLAWTLRLRARRFTEINLALAFPAMPDDERRRLSRLSLIETGMATTETAWVWKSPSERIRRHITFGDTAITIEHIRASGRGTLLASPHTGGWETTCLMGSDHVGKLAYFYRPPRDLSLEPVLLEGRANLGGTPLKLDSGGIRRAIRLLRAGDVVGILPDQEPDRNGGVFAPFFGEPALTMTLISRLIKASAADVLFVVAERTPSGWTEHCLAPDARIADDDPVVAATAINDVIERCVAIAPEQYLWSYRRFRELPEGGRRRY